MQLRLLYTRALLATPGVGLNYIRQMVRTHRLNFIIPQVQVRPKLQREANSKHTSIRSVGFWTFDQLGFADGRRGAQKSEE